MLSQSAILLTSCLMSALAGDHPDGSSKVSRSQDALGNYQFAYTISDVEGEHFRQEGTDSFGRVVGSYGLSHSDGRHRVVDYVADKDGFRARVRSNEPGMENIETVLGRSDHGLDTAATSNNDDDLLEQYGKRLKPTASRVAYVEADVQDAPPTRRTRPRRPPIYRTEETSASRDSRQHNLEDYQPSFEPRPPARFSIARPVKFGSDEPPDLTRRRPQSSPAVDIYRPPIDPNTAVRRPTFYITKDTEDNNNYPDTTTSRRPFIPPYGGFEDQLLSVDRYSTTGVPMTKIHGGLGGRKSYVPPTPQTRIYGAGRYPNDNDPPRYPNGDDLPPRHLSDITPPIPPRYPDDQIYDPLTGGVAGPPVGGPSPDDIYGRPPLSAPPQGLVLRAISIPNGIRAVRVDPTTGRIYDRLDYPVYLREDGISPPYDNNILIHNDDASDDTDNGRRQPGNYDIPLRGSNRPSLRDIRHLPFEDGYDPDSRVPSQQRYNGTSGDDLRLNSPTAKDLALINRHLSLVQQNRFGAPGRGYPNGVAYGPPTQGYPQFDDDGDEDVFRDGRQGFSPYSRTRPEYLPFNQGAGEFRLSRYPRNGSRSRRLSPHEAKETSAANLQVADSKTNGTVSEVKVDVVTEDKKE